MSENPFEMAEPNVLWLQPSLDSEPERYVKYDDYQHVISVNRRLWEQKELHRAKMLFWYTEQINPMRKLLGLSEFDYPLAAVEELVMKCSKNKKENKS